MTERIIGHGVDIVETDRIGKMLDRHGDHFLNRCFTEQEIAYANRNRHRDRIVEHLAGRFATKEAVLKALGTGWRDGIAWTDMEVQPDTLGKPILKVSGEVARLSEQQSITIWHISLSHSSQYAIGSAIAVAQVSNL